NPKDKCPICAMPLVKLEQQPAPGEALPAGVVVRLQLSPYKVVTAGIQTWTVEYEHLWKRIQTVGSVEFDERKQRRTTSLVNGRSRIDKLHVNYTGQTVHAGDKLAEIYNTDLATTLENLFDAQNERDKELHRARLRRSGISGPQIQEMEKEMKQIGKAITQVTLRSPIEGHVIKKYRVEGDWVGESEPIFDV